VSANWPRDLSTSIALNGEQAKQTISPVVRFEALDKSNLVTRTVSVETQKALEVKVEDKPKTITVPVATANTAVSSPEPVTGSSVPTWNAHVRVKK
jgi:hypothetical protein